MKRILLLNLAVLLAAVSLSAAEDRFIVHEWGVQVIGQTDGEQVLTAPTELLGGLPKFVGRNSSPLRFEAHGWDKPVIHLYGRDGLEFSVKVNTASGVPLAYYPHPKIEKGEIWGYSRRLMMAGKFHFEAGMEWKGTLQAADPKRLPRAPDNHWWNEARKIPSSYITTNLGSERFLFYEATAQQKPVINATLLEVAVQLENSFPEAVGPVIILLNDGTGIRGVERARISPGKPTLIAKADFREWSDFKVLDSCRSQWRALGINAAEAEGIVKVWESDLLKRLGVLVISPMPRELYDAMFPIAIEPKPDELVRVGLVFDTLPGQESRSAWLPGLEESLRKVGAQLASEVFSERAAAQFAFRSAGDLGTGVLGELVKSDKPEVRQSAKLLLEAAGPSDLGIEYLRPRSRQHAERLVEKFWPPREKEKLELPIE